MRVHKISASEVNVTPSLKNSFAFSHNRYKTYLKNYRKENCQDQKAAILHGETREYELNPLSTNPTKWPNTLKQFVGKLPTNCVSVFDHFVKLARKGLKQVCSN